VSSDVASTQPQSASSIRERLPVAKVLPGASRLNNFDALRLLAAFAVVISHSFAIAGNPQPTVGVMDAGTIGVVVFFGISGFLITQSWSTDSHLWRFAAKRALRIMPALIVVLLITTLILGPLVSSHSAADYFKQSATWSYLLQNAVMMTTHELPGVFTDLPYPRQVNAVLWTLQAEVLAYVSVAVIGLVGGFRTKWVPPLITAILIVAPHGLLPATSSLFMLQAFGVGASLYVLREYVPWHPGLVVIGLIAWAVTPEGIQLLLAVGVIPYATIFVAYRGPAMLRKLTARGDFSYGVYLIGWPVGQIVALLWGTSVTTAIVIGISLPITYLLAMASWAYLEQPALALKKHLGGRRNEPRVTAGLDRAAHVHQAEVGTEVAS
jgi:peptidoglycan/LPS O-acetylase OafA/YrhL